MKSWWQEIGKLLGCDETAQYLPEDNRSGLDSASVTSSSNVLVNASDATTFDGAVGATTPLEALATDGPGTTMILKTLTSIK